MKQKLLLLLLALAAFPAWAGNILFIATGNVPAGKFRLLTEVARPLGHTVEFRYVEKLPADVDAGLFRGQDLVVIDSYQEDYVRGRLIKALPGLKAPFLWAWESNPSWQGIPKDVAKRLVSYYANGGRRNFEGFFRTVTAQLQGKTTSDIEAPIIFPKAGIYHPKAPGLVFTDPAAYLRWKGVDPAHRPPTIAIAMLQQYISAEQTAFIDDLIARIEAAGVLPLPVYSTLNGHDTLSPTLTLQGKPIADVVINTQIMLDAEGRRKIYEGLGIPVIQAIPYRRGDEADWAADPGGINLMDVPFFLAQAEYAGVTDIQIAGAVRKGDEQLVSIAPQAAAVVNKALNLVRLQRLSNQDKKVAVIYWNYPPGEKNLTASFMNLPASLVKTLSFMKAEGFDTAVPGEKELTNLLQRLLAPYYRDGEIDGLLRDDLAELFPVVDYRAWLDKQPVFLKKEMLDRWGEPEKSAMVVRRNGRDYFVIPRLKLGKVALFSQPPRGEKWEGKEKAIYHSMKAGPSHFYLAVYLWARQKPNAPQGGFGADAFVHYGTHGNQEWLPGKERGLSVYDYPMLAVGDVPVAYPYIMDDVGEAIQAKRRGRAVVISHQTPPFSPAGLHDALTRLHDLLHAWLAQDEGAVKEKLKADVISGVAKERIDKDMGWTPERIKAQFPTFIDELHGHLHELSQTAQPAGLHTFGQAPKDIHRVGTVLMMLGKPFWEAAALHAGVKPEDADEALVGDYEKIAGTEPYRFLRTYLASDASTAGLSPILKEGIEKARVWYRNLGAQEELHGLLTVLNGQYLQTSYGGDPIKNPDAFPTGKNLYGFDPSRVPTKQAWAAGKEALENLLATHRRQSGKVPKKLTFALWSVETMRHMGLLEAQAFWALGVEPQWDVGGQITGVKLIPRNQLGRPRVDVVLSATGLYRDHFPNVMKWLALAAKLAAEADEPDNPVAANSRAIAQRLEQRGLAPDVALRAGQTRIFTSGEGSYGTGLDDAALATDTWQGKKEGDRKLAELYLSKMQYAVGTYEKEWGKTLPGVNLYAEHLKGTEGAVLSRTSNLYGMLTTDDPFQYLGGIALAVRHLDGKAPELYISNLRGNGAGTVEGAAQFLAKEMATRQFHPGYIKGLMAEGYSGTLQVLDATNNFWGWTAVAREIVRDDQWQELVDVYVRDKHKLGIRQWFERDNPAALAQVMERMLEAARQGYWQTDAATLDELKRRYKDLAQRFDVKSDNDKFSHYVGYGLAQPTSPLSSSAQTKQTAAAKPLPPPAPPPVRGMQLEKVAPPASQPHDPTTDVGLALLLLALTGGAWRQARPVVPTHFSSEGRI
ncbi:cobaltochelatase subunit CobN [Denitratisoma sp. DHT3]|uniref:cobaltochelatase subunit CobN n=1 Tax=Denitratisoma sp. DHT3 TaxID=1981880 RepID=UPI001198382B|nr:cobaltochelatase subunit CobN [Denitratisoma sp. DHT3]QDX79872.1 cobaltochelatase subunit CobN [Denitratisoma sp. DHT3]